MPPRASPIQALLARRDDKGVAQPVTVVDRQVRIIAMTAKDGSAEHEPQRRTGRRATPLICISACIAIWRSSPTVGRPRQVMLARGPPPPLACPPQPTA